MQKLLITLALTFGLSLVYAQAPLQPYTGTFSKPQLQHLLRRTLFGATLEDLQHFEGKTMQQVVDELLNVPSTPPEPPLWPFQFDYGDSLSFKAGKVWIGTPSEKATTQSIMQNSVNYWWHGLMLQQDRNIREKMVLFFENFLPSNNGKNNEGQGLFYYNRVKTLREHAVGNYKKLLMKITLEPSMMFYLDMNGSFAFNWPDYHYFKKFNPINPNENYAREVQELYTVGKGKNNNEQLFTEDDVKAAAHILSGWYVCNNKDASVVTTLCNGSVSYNTEYVPTMHSQQNKQFSPFYNNQLIRYQAGAAGGQGELSAFFDMLFARPETAENIVRKLYRYFVYAYISDDAEREVIQPLAKLFREGEAGGQPYELKPVLKALLTSAHFYDKEQIGCMIKNPYDYCVALMRMMGVKYQPKTELNLVAKSTFDSWDQKGNYIAMPLYTTFQALNGYTTATGMQLSKVPDVSGFPAYHQAPDYHRNWINAELLRRRKEMVFQDPKGLWSGLLTMSEYMTNFEPNKNPLVVALADKFSGVGNATTFVQQNIDYFLVQDLTDVEKAKLVNILESMNGVAWNRAWTAYKTNRNNYVTVYFKLVRFYEALFGYAEFQLM